jgi:hypothetical protein
LLLKIHCDNEDGASVVLEDAKDEYLRMLVHCTNYAGQWLGSLDHTI